MMGKRGPQNWPRANEGKGQAVSWLRDHRGYDKHYCLIWPFSRHPTGYGSFGYLGEMFYAHRFMCELVHGPAPSKQHQAAHSCGNGHKGCVNPTHLSWKTVSENLLDRREHGTAIANPVGRFGGLTEEQVAEIRRLKGIKTQQQLADMFGVKRPAIQYWQRHDRPRSKPGTSRTAIERRAKKAALRGH